MLTEHFFYNERGILPEGTMLELNMGGEQYNFPFTQANMICIKEEDGGHRDIAFILGPKNMPLKTDIRRYFRVKDSASRAVFKNTVMIESYSQKKPRLIAIGGAKRVTNPLGQSTKFDSKPFLHGIEGGTSPQDGAMQYRAMDNGTCAALLLAENTQGGNFILSLHAYQLQPATPLHKPSSLGLRILQGDLDEVFRYYTGSEFTRTDTMAMIPPMVERPMDSPVPGLPAVGFMGGPARQTVSKIESSPIRQYLKCSSVVTKQPAILSVTDPRNPMGHNVLLRALSKEVPKLKKGMPFTVEEMEDAMESVMEELERFLPLKSRVIPIIDSAKAFKEEGIGALPMKTSAGFKFRKFTGGSGKALLFDVNREPGDLLYKCIETLRDECELGEFHAPIFEANIKDETRAQGKIDSVMMRHIVSGPTDLTCLTRCYFGSFCGAMRLAGPLAHTALGMNVYGPEYDIAMKRMSDFSMHSMDADFKDYAMQFTPQMVDVIGTFIRGWYKKTDPEWTEEDDAVRACIFETIAHTYVVADGVLYRLDNGHPSGHALTTLVNCIGTILFNLMAYRRVREKLRPGLPMDSMIMMHKGYDGFWEGTRLIVLGDDNLQTIAEELLPYWNFFAFRDTLAEAGITITDGTKTGTPRASKNFFDSMFLSTTPRVGPAALGWPIVAATKDESLVGCLCYIRTGGGADPEALLNANCQDTLQRAWGRGREFFEDLRADIIQAFKQAGLEVPRFWTYGQLYQRYKEGVLCLFSAEDNEYEAAAVSYRRSLMEPDGVRVTYQMDQAVVISGSAPAQTQEGLTDMAPPAGGAPLQEMQYDIRSVCARKQLISTFPWSVGDAPGATLFTANVPSDLLRGAALRMIDAFTYAVFDSVDVHITVQGSRFHQGRLIAYSVPLTTSATEQALIAGSKSSQLLLPHVWLNPTSSETAILTIPFLSPLSLLDLRALVAQRIANVHIAVFNGLAADAGAAQAVSVTVLAAFTSMRAHVLRVHNIAAVHEVEEADEKALDVKMQGGRMSKVTNYNYDHVVDSNIGATSSSDNFDQGVDASATVSPLDRPLNSLSTFSVTSQAPRLTSAVNITAGTYLGLDPRSERPLDPSDFSNSADLMDLGELGSTFTFLTTVSWQMSHSPGTFLHSHRLSPMASYDSAILGSVVVPSLMSYIAVPFAFWNGDLEVRVEVVCTDMHAGRLLLMPNYGVQSTSDVDPLQLEQYGFVLTLEPGMQTVDFVIPYVSQTQYMDIPNSSNPLGATLDNARIGLFTLSVYSGLVGPSTVPDAVDVNIYVRSHSVKLAFPGARNRTIKSTEYFDTGGPARSVRYQMDTGEAVGEDVVPSGEPDVTTSVGVVESPNVQGAMGAQMSINALSKRAYPMLTISAQDEDQEFLIPAGAFLTQGHYHNAASGGPQLGISGFARWASIFRIWGGGVVCYLEGIFTGSISVTTESSLPALDDAIYDDSTSIAMNSAPLQNTTSLAPYMAGYAPFRSRYRFCLVPHDPDDLTDTVYNHSFFTVLIKGKSMPAGSKVILSLAGGDNFRLGQPYIVPHTELNHANIPPDKWGQAAGSVDIPPTIKVTAPFMGGTPLRFSHETMNGHSAIDFNVSLGPPLPYNMNWMRFDSTLLTDEELNMLGYQIKSGQTRNYTGVEGNVNKTFDNYDFGPATLIIRFVHASGKPLAALPKGIPMHMPGSVVSEGVEVGATAEFTTPAWDYDQFRREYLLFHPSHIPVVVPGHSLTRDVNLKHATVAGVAVGLLTHDPAALTVVP